MNPETDLKSLKAKIYEPTGIPMLQNYSLQEREMLNSHMIPIHGPIARKMTDSNYPRVTR